VKKSRNFPKISKPNGSPYKEPKTKHLLEMLVRAQKIQRQLDEVKPLYHELDEITFALVRVKERLESHGAVIVDNFAEKNTQFKTVGIRRYELKWR
jgi:hypothetical protein